MKSNTLTSFAVVIFAFAVMMAGCKTASEKKGQVAGTMEEPVPSDMMPDHVQQALTKAIKYHCHDLLNDTVNVIYVSSIDEVDQTSTEGYGINVTKGALSTTFPNIRHTREPQAKYNATTGDLWLTSPAMEGTGVRVEWLHQIRFGDNGLAYVKTEVNPYGVQLELLHRLSYIIKGETISLYDGDKLLATVTSSVKDMGGFDDEQPLWIGEQLYYDVSSGNPKVIFAPGVKFTTGNVLIYDDMPELSAPFTIDENGLFAIHEITTMCCSCRNNAAKGGLSPEQAFEGVSNYCHGEYDWSAAEDNASIMTLEMGEETETEYQVVFRSYTGAYVYFYVDKKSGTTRMVEHVPTLDITEETGTIELKDYL